MRLLRYTVRQAHSTLMMSSRAMGTKTPEEEIKCKPTLFAQVEKHNYFIRDVCRSHCQGRAYDVLPREVLDNVAVLEEWNTFDPTLPLCTTGRALAQRLEPPMEDRSDVIPLTLRSDSEPVTSDGDALHVALKPAETDNLPTSRGVRLHRISASQVWVWWALHIRFSIASGDMGVSEDAFQTTPMCSPRWCSVR